VDVLDHLVKPGSVFVELVHAELIGYPQPDEQGAGQPGGETHQVDEKGDLKRFAFRNARSRLCCNMAGEKIGG
jgi:hypothetical protein